jgi:excisionase family DNA binding protein
MPGSGGKRSQFANDAREIMTLRELADFLRCHPALVYRLVSRGDIPGFKLIGEWRFRRSDIERWLDRRTQQRAKSPARRLSHATPSPS